MLQRSKQQMVQRLSPSKFIALKIYPNREMLSKSKIIKFTSHYKCFEERARIFIESCYLLIGAQIQKRQVYMSTNIFTNFYGSVFMVYSLDSQYKQQMKEIRSGNLINEIIAIFDLIFGNTRNNVGTYIEGKEENNLGDIEMKKIWQNAVELIGQLEKVKPVSKDYFYQVGNHVYPWNTNKSFEPSNIYAVVWRLQSCLMFQQYSFHLKCENGQLIRPLLQLKPQYQKLMVFNIKLFKSMTEQHSEDSPADLMMKYQGQFVSIFKILQKENYLKIIRRQQGQEKQKKEKLLLQISFETNLRKYSHLSLTSNEQSSESMNQNSDMLQLDQINICKNSIEFYIKIKPEDAKIKLEESKGFVIEIQAICKWKIQQIYFVEVNKLWDEVIGTWGNFIYETEDLYLDKSRPLKFELSRSQKDEEKVRIKTLIQAEMRPSLTKEAFLAVDKMLTFSLLFESVLKNMAKFSRYYTDNYDNYVKKIHSSAFMEDMISQLKCASLDYEQYFTALEKLQ